MLGSLPRSARLFLGGRWICSAGDWLGGAALGWLLVNELRGGSTAFALNRLLVVIGLLMFAPVAGAALKKMSAVSMLIMSCFIAASVAVMTAAIAWVGGNGQLDMKVGLWIAVGLGLVGGMAQAFRDSGEQRIQAILVPEKHQGQLEHTWLILFYIGRLVFGVASGVILGLFGAALLFLLDGATFVILALTTFIVRGYLNAKDPAVIENGSTGSPKRSLKVLTGLRYGMRHYGAMFHETIKRPELPVLLLMLIAVEGIGFTAWMLLPEIINKEFGAGGFAYGACIGIGGVGGIIGVLIARYVLSSPRWHRRLFVVGATFSPLGLLGASLSPNWWTLSICYGVAIMGWSWFISALRVYFRKGENGHLTAAMLTFVLLGVCRTLQAALTATYCSVLEIRPTSGLFISSIAGLLVLAATIVLGRKLLRNALQAMFPE